MKIVMFEPDPMLSYGTDLCNALSDLGAEVVLFTTRDYAFQSRARFEVQRVAPPSVAGRYMAKAGHEAFYLSYATSHILRRRPDIVHFQWFRMRAEIAYMALLRLIGLRLVWTAHNALPHEAHWGDLAYHRLLYRLPRKLIVHTEGTKTQLLRSFNVRSEAVAVIPHGNYEHVPHEVMPRPTARARLGLPMDATIFLFYGQLRPYKGYVELLEAFAQAAPSAPDAILVIAGRASDEVAGQMHKLVSALPESARGRVHLHVQVNTFLRHDLTDELFSATDVVVLPYRSVWQSGVLFQAFGYARPVLASALGGFVETIQEGKTGYLFPAGDRNALARRLAELSRDRHALEVVGLQARKGARRENNWEQIARLTLEVYRSAQ